ncbi:hypothetical protein [uncultured Limnobacter sp.]|uniref:hypothetical protein n=1 Tax=Rheinheimera sp. WS51 TaxID=3425886 RepID=UPI0032B213CB|tara:strand:- start:4015 stop:4329 length:315 start_codon:yes stop_codon:yes gene_type:complete
MRSPFQEGVDSLKAGNYYCSLNPYCRVAQPAEHEQWGKGWYSAYREAAQRHDNEYLVTWVGMDRSYHEDEFSSLENAQRHAVSISEHGGHSITLSDDEGNEYDF